MVIFDQCEGCEHFPKDWTGEKVYDRFHCPKRDTDIAKGSAIYRGLVMCDTFKPNESGKWIIRNIFRTAKMLTDFYVFKKPHHVNDRGV